MSHSHPTAATKRLNSPIEEKACFKMGKIVASRLMSRPYARNVNDFHDKVPRLRPRTLERHRPVHQMLCGKLSSVVIKKSDCTKITNLQKNLELHMKNCISSNQICSLKVISNYKMTTLRLSPEKFKLFINNNVVTLFHFCESKIRDNLGACRDFSSFEIQIRRKLSIIGFLARRRVAEFLKPYPESELTESFVRSVLKALDGNVCYILAEAMLILMRPCTTLEEGRFIFQYYAERLFEYLDEFGRGNSHSIMNVDGHCGDYEDVVVKALEYSDSLSELLRNKQCDSEYYTS